MPVVYHCPNPGCRKRYHAADALVGRLSKCKQCGRVLRIPRPGEEATPAELPPPAAPAPPLDEVVFDLDDDLVPLAPPPRVTRTARPTGLPVAVWALGGAAAAAVVVAVGLAAVYAGPHPPPPVTAAPADPRPAPPPPPRRDPEPEPPAPAPPQPEPEKAPEPPVEPKAKTPAPKGEVPAPTGATPRVAAAVAWEFKRGESGVVVTPHHWKTTVTLTPGDGGPWTVVPDLVVGEAAGGASLSQGASREAYTRPRYTLFGSPSGGQLPAGAGETVSPLLVIGDRFFLGYQLDRSWRLNGKAAAWEPTRVGRGDALVCAWVHATGTTLDGAKTRADYRPFHLGPLVYDPADPAAPCYAVAALGAAEAGKGNAWACPKADLIPLTADAVRREAENPARPDDWRAQFLVWAWSQPRPVPDAGRLLHDAATSAALPPSVRAAAAASVLGVKYEPGVPTVVGMIRAKDGNPGVRRALLEVPGAAKAVGLDPLAALARDAADAAGVRRAALDALRDHGDAGWAVIRGLAGDRDVGPRVKELLAAREKR